MDRETSVLLLDTDIRRNYVYNTLKQSFEVETVEDHESLSGVEGYDYIGMHWSDLVWSLYVHGEEPVEFYRDLEEESEADLFVYSGLDLEQMGYGEELNFFLKSETQEIEEYLEGG